MKNIKLKINRRIEKLKRQSRVYGIFALAQLPILAAGVLSLVTIGSPVAFFPIGVAGVWAVASGIFYLDAKMDYKEAVNYLKEIQRLEEEGKAYLASRDKADSATKEDYTTYTEDRDNSFDKENSKE